MLTIIGGEVLEGNSNFDGLIVYTASLSEAALTPVTFEYRGRSGTADRNGDFDSVSGTVTFAAGETTATFTVRTVADNGAEADESILVDIFNVTGAALANGEDRTTVQSVILDDDGTGLKRVAFVNDVTIVEGDGGSKQAIFEVRLSRPADEALTLTFETRDGTAIAGSDYTGTSGSITFAAGQTVQSVAVDVAGDVSIEGSEQFSLVIAPTPGDANAFAVDFAGGIATILDDDASATAPSLTIIGGEVLEGNSNFDGLIVYTASLSEAALTPVTFEYRGRSGTADRNGDFDGVSGTVTFAAGETTATFTVRTVADNGAEADESILVDIFNVTGAALANGEDRTTVQSVILDDDGTGLKRAAFVNDVTIVEGDGGSKQAIFEVRLSRPADEALTLTFETRDGTAIAGSDYTGTSGSITFAAGQTVQSVAIDVAGDVSIEGSEQFSLVIAPTPGDANAFAVDFAGGIATILDDDASATAPSLTIIGGEVLEGNSNFDGLIVYTASLSEAALTPVTFEYRGRSGTADRNGDFDGVSGTVTFAAGETTATFTVRTVADNGAEADESILVDIFNVTGAALANGEDRTTVQSVILDDDGTGLKRVAFVNDVTIVEGDGGSKQAIFEVRLSRPADEALTLTFETRDGTAIAGSDYTGTSGSITFAAGQTVQSVAIDVAGDVSIEGSEQFSLVIAPTPGDANAFAVDFAGGIATILDDDTSATAPSLTIIGGEVLEGSSNFDGSVVYTASLSEAALTPVTFEYRGRSGTADRNGDFDGVSGTVTFAAGETTATFTVRTVADNGAEADESILVDIFNVTGAALANGEDRTTVQSVILDDDGTGLKRAAFVNDVTIVEGDGGSKQAIFEVRLSRPADTEVSFNYTTVQSSAASNGDFTGLSSAATTPLVFAPGQTVASIAIDVSSDTQSEASETFQLVLTTASSLIEGGGAGAIGTATILDDDSGFGIFPEISISDGEVLEGNSNFDGLIAYTISLSSVSNIPVSVAFEAISGTAEISSDFDILNNTLIIPAGETTAHLFVRTVADNTVEDDETVILELSNPSNGVFAGGAGVLRGIGTILDDDTPAPGAGTPRIIVQDTTAAEGETATFTLIRVGQTTQATTGTYEILPGTADAGADFSAVSGTFSFAIGQNVTTIAVPVAEDAQIEGVETFVLRLSDIENGVLPGVATEAYAIATIDGQITASNPPVANDDTAATNENQPITINVLNNDTDQDNDVLSIASVVTTGTLGQVTQNNDGSFSYDPNGAFENLGAGESANDTFTYAISDGRGRADTATVTITVEGVNDAPRANADSDVTVENRFVDINVIGNDTDPESDALTIASVAVANNGTTQINANNTVRYTPNADFVGVDTFSYTISDNNGGTSTSEVSVKVAALPDLFPSLTIIGGEVLEGNSNFDGLIVYTASLSEAALTPVTFEYRGRSGTADRNGDFDSVSGTVTFAAGETTATFTVRTVADNGAEADESILVDIFNVTGAALANGEDRTTVQSVILDDDGTGLKRAAFVNDVTIVEGDGGSKQAIFEVRLSRPADEALTLTFETRDGTAIAGSDYTGTSGSITFAAGQTVQSVAIDVAGDVSIEGSEQFSLVIAPTPGDANAFAVDFAGGIATILDDDASATAPSLTIIGGEVLEGNSNFDGLIVYTASLSEAALTPVTFEYRGRSGTADRNGDFDGVSGTVTFAAGETTATFTVRTVADNGAEADESILVDIFNVTGAALANGEDRTTVQSVILDDDGTGLKRVAFVNDVTIVEGDGGSKQAIFEVRLSRPADEALTLTFETRDGTAIAGSDYTGTSGSITFAAGQTVQSVAIDVAGDVSIEGSEQFSLVIAPTPGDANAFAVDFAGGIATILDDDTSATAPSLTIIGGEVLEGSSNFDGSVVYTASLSEAALTPVTFEYRGRSGTADRNGDFDGVSGTVTFAAGETTATFTVRTVADNGAEADESILVDIFNVTGAALANGEDRTTVQSVILDDDGTGLKRAAFVNDVTIVEGDGGSKQAIFEVRLSRPADTEVSFNYTTVQSSAASNGDFTGLSSAATTPLVFAPGQTVASIAIDVSSDTQSEASETFQLVLTTASSLIEGGGAGAIGTATILDDDSGFGIFPEISISDGEVLEGNSNFDGLIAYTISLSSVSNIPVSVAFEAISGTAEISSDFDILNNTLIIPAGETTAHLFVRTVADNTVEDDETVILELSNPSNGVFAGGAGVLRGIGTILDDDTPAPGAGTPRIIVQDTTAAEGETATFTLIRVGQTTQATTGTYEILPGTADAGADFSAVSGTFSFAIGQNVTTIAVPVAEDAQIEGVETFVLRLSDIENGVLPGVATEAYAIATIDGQITASNPPVANDDTAATNENQPITINVLNNDTDQDNDVLVILDLGDASNGSVTTDGTSIVYTPTGGFIGVDTFSYTVSDGNGGTSGADVQVTVAPTGFTYVLSNDQGGTLLARSAAEFFDLGDGIDIVSGIFAALNGDIVRDFEQADSILFEGSIFEPDAVQIMSGDNTILSFDVDGDGTTDGELTLEGDYSGESFEVFSLDGDTVIRLAGSDASQLSKAGERFITSDTGANRVYGDDGDDVAVTGAGDDLISAGAGSDVVVAGDGEDVILGGLGADNLTGGAGADIFAFSAADFGSGFTADFITDFRPGEDVIELSGFGFTDLAGLDIVTVAEGDAINLGAGRFIVLEGLTAADLMDGDIVGAEFARTYGLISTTAVHRLTDADDRFISTDTGATEIFGRAGADAIVGGTGNDTIFGEAGADVLIGGGGDDDLIGGSGADQMTGLSGADNFVFTSGEETGFVAEFITDYELGIDRLTLEGFGITSADDFSFTTSGTGDVALQLASTRFVVFEGYTEQSVIETEVGSWVL